VAVAETKNKARNSLEFRHIADVRRLAVVPTGPAATRLVGVAGPER